MRFTHLALVVGTVSVVAPPALAQAPAAAQAAGAPSADQQKTTEGAEDRNDTPEYKLPFRESWLILDNAVTTQTVGVGSSYQSSNPTYEMSLGFRPRYFFTDANATHEWHVGGRIDLVHEFTNSDVTTKEGETTFSDANIYFADKWKIGGNKDTWLLTQLPVLTFPTSKFSMDNGTILGVGLRGWFNQNVRLAPSAPVFKEAHFGITTSYTHTFTTATTATNPELRRVRLEPDGRTLPGDQLTGAAFPAHELAIGALAIADITEKFQLWLDASYRPTWLYSFSPVKDEKTPTGNAPVRSVEDPTTYVVTTSFAANLYYDLIPELTIGVGYENVAAQPAPDGLRRSIFYSPGAQFHLVLWGHLDSVYVTLAGQREPEKPKQSASTN
jgi:hypothetical protein